MNIVKIIVNVVSIPENSLPNNFRPCPRINIFKHPYDPLDITRTGVYNQTFILEKGERCGVDVFHWQNQKSEIMSQNTDSKILAEIVGQNKDQIKKTINITKAGEYNISIEINK